MAGQGREGKNTQKEYISLKKYLKMKGRLQAAVGGRQSPKKKSLGKQKNPRCVLLWALETLDIKTDKEETDQKAAKVLFKMFEQTQNLIRNF